MRAKSQRQPNLGAASERKKFRPLCSTRKIKLRWKDANDCALVAINGNVLANQRGITAEAPLPKSVTDQRDRRSAGRVLFGSQGPPQQRYHPKRLKEPVRYTSGAEALRVASVCEVGGAWRKGSDPGEAL